MKLCVIVQDRFLPQKKCGAEAFPLIGSIFLGGASIFNGISQSNTSLSNLEAQLRENQRSREFSHEENQLARSWAEDEWTRQFAASKSDTDNPVDYTIGNW